MIEFNAILTSVKSALDADETLALVPSIIDLGFSDKAVERYLEDSGLCIAIQPIFGWQELEPGASEMLGGPMLVAADVDLRVWISAQALEKGEQVTIGGDPCDTTTGNVTLSDDSTIGLWDLMVRINAVVGQISGGETVGAIAPTTGILTALDPGVLCYDLAFTARAKMSY